MKYKNLWAYLISLLAISFMPALSWAFCPVCVVAVGAGLGLARWLGVDDTVTGIWIGAFLIAIVGWFITWLKNKKWTFPYFGPIILIATYALTLIPLYYRDIIGHPKHTIFGIDKLIFSIALGSIALVASELLYKWLKKRNNNKPYFPYQKIVMPIVFLAILSVIFYFVTKTPH
jgi:hypothetical protein